MLALYVCRPGVKLKEWESLRICPWERGFNHSEFQIEHSSRRERKIRLPMGFLEVEDDQLHQ